MKYERIGPHEVHPAASIYPMIDGEELRALADDIRANGLREPVVKLWVEDPVAKGMQKPLILDGRNRLRACELAKVAPEFDNYEGPTDLRSLILFVRSRNFSRRHLNESQRALVAARELELLPPAPLPASLPAKQASTKKAKGTKPMQKANVPSASKPTVQARDVAGAALNVSGRSVQHAVTVLKSAAPEVVRAVERGEVAVSAAAELAKRPKAEQREILEQSKGKAGTIRAHVRQRERIELGKKLDAVALPRGSVQLVLTDPPWGATRARWDRPLDWGRWWEAIDHALTPQGIVAAFASIRLALEIIPRARRRFAYDLVWKKNRASGHLNAKRAPLRAHETILVFGDSARGPSVYRPQMTDGHEPMHGATRRSRSELYGRETITTTNKGTTLRYATSVLEVDVVGNDSDIRIHPCQKPIDLLRWFVRAYTAPGDLVADLTCGSGAAIHASRREGRRGIGWEIDDEIAPRAQAWLEGRDLPLFAEVGA